MLVLVDLNRIIPAVSVNKRIVCWHQQVPSVKYRLIEPNVRKILISVSCI